MSKKIEEFMLSKDLQEKINKVSSMSHIQLDQLDQSLVNLLTNVGDASKGMVSYDDSDLRSRIIYLENNSATKTGWFNKTNDKLSKEQLNEELQGIINDMLDFADMLATKISKSEADNTYRNKETKITAQDFSEELRNNLTNLNNRVNALNNSFGNLNFVSNDIVQLKEIINDLPNTALTKTTGDELYRAKVDKIVLADLSDEVQEAVKVLIENYSKLSEESQRERLEKYRLLTDDIDLSDLSPDLREKFETISQLSGSIKETIDDAIAKAITENFADRIGSTYVGQFDLLKNVDVQEKIKDVLVPLHVDVADNATLVQTIYYLIQENKRLSDDLSSLQSIVDAMQEQVTAVYKKVGIIEELDDMEAPTLLKGIIGMGNYPDMGIDAFDYDISLGDDDEMAEGEPKFYELSSSGSATIIQADAADENFTEDNILIKAGYKSMAANAIHDASVLAYINTNEIELIQTGAIKNLALLYYVKMPNVKTINDGAFSGCDNIKRIVLPLNYNVTGKEGFPAGAQIERVIKAGA